MRCHMQHCPAHGETTRSMSTLVRLPPGPAGSLASSTSGGRVAKAEQPPQPAPPWRQPSPRWPRSRRPRWMRRGCSRCCACCGWARSAGTQTEVLSCVYIVLSMLPARCMAVDAWPTTAMPTPASSTQLQPSCHHHLAQPTTPAPSPAAGQGPAAAAVPQPVCKHADAGGEWERLQRALLAAQLQGAPPHLLSSKMVSLLLNLSSLGPGSTLNPGAGAFPAAGPASSPAEHPARPADSGRGQRPCRRQRRRGTAAGWRPAAAGQWSCDRPRCAPLGGAGWQQACRHCVMWRSKADHVTLTLC